MIGLTLKHLRYFDALSRNGHFGRAAASCGISQPALSVQIKELEGLMGAALVERGAREIRLTALGEEFWARTRSILTEVSELDSLVRASDGPLSGRLRLGLIPTVAPYLLPRLLDDLKNEMPALIVRPREMVTRILISDLMESRLDAAIVALPVSEPGLHEEPLFDEEFLLLRPSADQHKPTPTPDDLRDGNLLLLAEGHCFRDQALSFCQISASAPPNAMEGSSLSTLVQMVGAGMGMTFIPEMAVTIEARAAPVDTVRLAAPAPRRTIGMVWRKTSPLNHQLVDIGKRVQHVWEQMRETAS